MCYFSLKANTFFVNTHATKFIPFAKASDPLYIFIV